MKYTSFVNVFHGNGTIRLPDPQGIAKSWHFIKALCGNTHPGAVLPFGKYSAAPYSGGYSSGCGTNTINTCGPIAPLMPQLRLKGFSHFQHSGTGAIGVYYNYAPVTPFYHEPAADYGIADETAAPGYYAVTLAETGIRCELTVCPFAALHRYTFDREGGAISIDFTNDGLYDHPALRGHAEDLTVTCAGDNTLEARVTLQGVRLFFVVGFSGDGVLDAQGIYRLRRPGAVTLSLSVSAESMEVARKEAAQVPDFDRARMRADHAWETALSRIRIDSDDPAETALFYSNLYHSLVKPCDWEGGGFLWDGAPFMVDFATLWDIYKTATPLIFTLYPEVSEHIVATYEKLGEALGKLPHCFMLTTNTDIESKQARLSAVHMLYDAWKRGVRGNWPGLCDAMIADILRPEHQDFIQTGICPRTTHMLDMAEGCAAAAELAAACGREDAARTLEDLACRWSLAYDPATGLLWEDREYYEGNHWNYSFRPLRRMEARIALSGGSEAFEAALDRFFGFAFPEDTSARFEGFNNETDMEAPYAYCYIGRQDKLCQILDSADRYLFRTADGATGPGGIPGNNDSGGLSSCYIWNTLGIFPVSGQDLMLIGKPKFPKAVLELSNGKTLTILRRGSGSFPVAAELNGVPCRELRLGASEMMQGGTLTIHT